MMYYYQQPVYYYPMQYQQTWQSPFPFQAMPQQLCNLQPMAMPQPQTNPGKPAAPVTEKRNVSAPGGLAPDKFTAKDLTQADLDTIISKYGTEIDDIFNLAPGQAWMFGKAQKVTSAFFIQSLLRVTLKLKPSTFRQRVDALSLKRSNFRTAIAYRGQEKPYQVVLKNRRPELHFVDRSDKTLSELGEELDRFRAADRRRGFDLERDPLLRITVFCTAEEDTYALVISQPHINDDGASEMMLFKELLMDYAMEGKFKLPELPAGSYQDYANYLQGIDKEAELRYWEELLASGPTTRLPGRMQSTMEPAMNSLELHFYGAQGEKAALLPKRYKATMNSIVQSAWGIMLQKLYGTKAAVFGSITSGRAAEVANSNTMTGGFVNAFPVLVTAEDGETFASVVSRTQMQIIRSMQMAHCSPDEISARLGRTEPIFDHLLNFHNFSDATKEMPAMPGISVLSAEVFDNLSTGFCLYFRTGKEGLNCIFSYDRRAFTDRKVRVLADCFRQVFEQLLDDDGGEVKVDALKCPDISAFITARRDEEEERTRLESALRTVPLFDGVDDDGIAALAEMTEVHSIAEGDEIMAEKQPLRGVHIVLEGLVQLSRTTIHGWENPVSVRKSGELLTASGVLENGTCYFSAKAFISQARMAFIPGEEFRSFMASHPTVAVNLVREEERHIKSLSSMWINAN